LAGRDSIRPKLWWSSLWRWWVIHQRATLFPL
jgi:hypothetical protein